MGYETLPIRQITSMSKEYYAGSIFNLPLVFMYLYLETRERERPCVACSVDLGNTHVYIIYSLRISYLL